MSQGGEQLKQIAAEYALQQYVHSNMTIGLGTGSTVRYFVEALAKCYHQNELTNISCLSTSEATTTQARLLELPLVSYGDLLASELLDITIDGADTVNRHKQLIKGGGGALTREKIIAYNSHEVIIVIDESKYTHRFSLGTVVPLEVLEVAHHAVTRQLTQMHYRGQRLLFSAVNVRRSKPNGVAAHTPSLYYTDNGNVILDATLSIDIKDAKRLEAKLNSLPGVVENGFFTALKAIKVVMATGRGVSVL